MANGIQITSAVTYIVIIAAVIGVFYALFKIFKIPVKTVTMAVFNFLIGICMLFVANYLFSLFGFTIGINPVTAAVAGFLGIPGLITLVILNFWV
jgi:inhibitor of the pro-sigma K processing machinery